MFMREDGVVVAVKAVAEGLIVMTVSSHSWLVFDAQFWNRMGWVHRIGGTPGVAVDADGTHSLLS